MTHEEIEAIVKATVHSTLSTLGIDAANPFELQKDFSHLRSWRKSTDQMKQAGFLSVIGILVSGILGLIWSAIKVH